MFNHWEICFNFKRFFVAITPEIGYSDQQISLIVSTKQLLQVSYQWRLTFQSLPDSMVIISRNRKQNLNRLKHRFMRKRFHQIQSLDFDWIFSQEVRTYRSLTNESFQSTFDPLTCTLPVLTPLDPSTTIPYLVDVYGIYIKFHDTMPFLWIIIAWYRW